MNGDPITNRDIVDLVLAVDDDGNDRHAETLDLIADQSARLVVMEEWRASCPAGSLADYVAAEHDHRHAVHMVECHPPRREDDPPDADHTDDRRGFSAVLPDEEIGDMRRAWRFVRWIVVAFGSSFAAYGGYRLAQIVFGP
jgi:hypothetical protein